jgi:hypothetical protein
VVDNTPILLVRDGQFIEEALTKARVTHSDVYAKLRQSNVHRMDQVIAVVLETTGDISVVHGEGRLDAELYDNVRQLRPMVRSPATSGDQISGCAAVLNVGLRCDVSFQQRTTQRSPSTTMWEIDALSDPVNANPVEPVAMLTI